MFGNRQARIQRTARMIHNRFGGQGLDSKGMMAKAMFADMLESGDMTGATYNQFLDELEGLGAARRRR